MNYLYTNNMDGSSYYAEQKSKTKNECAQSDYIYTKF
jgi:hypothetical protein